MAGAARTSATSSGSSMIFPAPRFSSFNKTTDLPGRLFKRPKRVIRNNSQRKEKELFSLREIGETPTYYQAEDDKEEAAFITKTIYERLGEPGRSYRHVALLYRTNAQSRVLEDSCRRNNIPYIIVGGLKFYDRKEVKDMIAYLHVLVNPRDSVSLRRMINVPIRGIGGGTVTKLEEWAKAQDITLLEAARKAALVGIPEEGDPGASPIHRNDGRAHRRKGFNSARGIREKSAGAVGLSDRTGQ